MIIKDCYTESKLKTLINFYLEKRSRCITALKNLQETIKELKSCDDYEKAIDDCCKKEIDFYESLKLYELEKPIEIEVDNGSN